MIKTIIFLLLSVFLNADYLNTVDKNKCVFNVEPWQNRKGLCYKYSADNTSACLRSLTFSKLINGYEYINGGCYQKELLNNTGLSQEDFDYFMILLAHAFGLTFSINKLFIYYYIKELTPMNIYDFTNNIPFNTIFSIYVNLTIMLAPILALYALFSFKIK